ncbi:Rha family transcriptional regulator [Bacteroides faecis]|jgi:Rha family phage regulatory protein|uniref:Phage regulatory protein Rha (Phage_pRha) n=1 Tax=Bacteroides faecis TaxID=674529 RepID=A0A6N2WMA7_9BACE|nr:Rha family transcriptional regulator [Bacteroides faecis]CDC89772.1 putative phage antirepressor [Bacteroides faecis CAG:32]MCB6635614.1 phage regulatory protein/antirepressor Ant [Bacteroides faecis]MCE8943950.1 phage regulatory protein/antirepressor Ant [Bacteroides faecis]MCS3068624.1 phage regulatory protein/antirepressor Ant [Bacteroides faecis]MCS3125001.1 phage regulatory protein/antirepressor Ant [Bacteroides faecis]
MNDIVFQGSEGQPLTNSVLVAEKFGKVHKNVIRTIQGLITTAQNCAVLIAENSAVRKMFVETTYLNEQNKEQPMYVMNRDGFTLLAMGFTGKKALQFKLDYIEAFNKMEKAIKEVPTLPSPIDITVLKQLVETTQVMAAQINQMQSELTRQRELPTIPTLQNPLLSASEQRISPRQCKYYTVKQMAKALNSDPRDLNAFLEYKRVQEYDNIKQKWVLDSSLVGRGLTYTVVYEPVDPDEEPREYMVWTPKGRDYIWELLLNEKRKYQENAKGR